MHDAGVEEVAAVLLQGGAVVLPTDTVYGLVAIADDQTATSKLFALKGRSDAVPIAVLCASVAQALSLADVAAGSAAAVVADRWWPGPLTLVLPRRAGVELHVGEPSATVGVRVPDHALVRALATRVGPLAATSANRHGSPTAATVAQVRLDLGGGVSLYVDGGRLTARASTVVDATGAPWRVLREGPLDTAEILAAARDAAG